MTLNTLLELHNGAWMILSAFLLFALTRYLFVEHRLRDLSMKRWIAGLPVSMQLALGLWVTALGIFIRSGAVWCWRAFSHGINPMPRPYEVSLVVGGLLACVGMLCLIRVVTRPAFGHQVWQTAAVCVVIYIGVTVAV